MSLNKVLVLGRLGQDPELKFTPSGAAVANFSLATSEKWKDRDGNMQEKVEWHRVVVWGKLAENCQKYLAKGREALVEGRLQTRSWDAPNGEKKYVTEIIATSVQFIGGNQQAQTGGQAQMAPAPQGQSQQHAPHYQQHSAYQPPQENNFTADDIPF